MGKMKLTDNLKEIILGFSWGESIVFQDKDYLIKIFSEEGYNELQKFRGLGKKERNHSITLSLDDFWDLLKIHYNALDIRFIVSALHELDLVEEFDILTKDQIIVKVKEIMEFKNTLGSFESFRIDLAVPINLISLSIKDIKNLPHYMEAVYNEMTLFKGDGYYFRQTLKSSMKTLSFTTGNFHANPMSILSIPIADSIDGVHGRKFANLYFLDQYYSLKGNGALDRILFSLVSSVSHEFFYLEDKLNSKYYAKYITLLLRKFSKLGGDDINWEKVFSTISDDDLYDSIARGGVRYTDIKSDGLRRTYLVTTIYDPDKLDIILNKLSDDNIRYYYNILYKMLYSRDATKPIFLAFYKRLRDKRGDIISGGGIDGINNEVLKDLLKEEFALESNIDHII